MAKKAINISVILVLVFSILLLAACGKPETTTAPTTTKTAASTTTTTLQPKYGGVLKMIQFTSPTGLGYPPELTTGDHVFVQGCIESLFKTDLKDEPHPFLATDWKWSPDNLSLTVNLRQGVMFHDGTPFNAEAVKWNLMEQKTARRVSGSELLSSVDVIDEYTVRINLSKYQSYIIYELNGPLGEMVSPTAVQKNGQEWASANPVGTGPFKFVEWQKDICVRYKRFDNYWQKGQPYLDGLEFYTFADQVTASAAFQSGEFKIMTDVSPKLTSDLEKMGYNLARITVSTQVLVPDSDNPGSPYAKKEVRLAIEYALDKEALAKAFGYNYWGPLYQFCVPAYAGYNPNLEERRYDPDKARALLAEAGYSGGFDTTLYANPSFIGEDVVVAMQGMLDEVGIKAHVQMLTVAPFIAKRSAGWENALMFQRISFQPNLAATFNYFFGPGPAAFKSMWRAPEFYQLMDGILAETDANTRAGMAEDLVSVVYENSMIIPVFGQDRIYTMDSSVHGQNFFKAGNLFNWTPGETWMGD